MRLLFCYAAADANHRERLEKHLAVLQSRALLTWDAQQVDLGLDIAAQVEVWLQTTDALLLLLSADFFADPACQKLCERARARGLLLVPVVVRPFLLAASDFADTQVLPARDRPVSSFADPDEAWTLVTQGLLALSAAKSPPPPPPAALRWEIPRESRDFSGREALLAALRDRFRAATLEGVGHVQMVSGLGGVGKSQLARAYAHRHRGHYQVGLRVDGSSEIALRKDLAALAGRLGLKDEPAAEAALRWLSEQRGWLLIVDSADDLQVVRPLCSALGAGHLLVTTRQDSDEGLGSAPPLRLEKWSAAEALTFLRRRCERPTGETAELEALVAELDGLPLALEQAGAHLARLKTPAASYLQSLRKRRLLLLKERPTQGDYPCSVATTWDLNIQQVRAAAPAAAALMECVAFLAPDAIPEEIFVEGAAALGSPLQGRWRRPPRTRCSSMNY